MISNVFNRLKYIQLNALVAQWVYIPLQWEKKISLQNFNYFHSSRRGQRALEEDGVIYDISLLYSNAKPMPRVRDKRFYVSPTLLLTGSAVNQFYD